MLYLRCLTVLMFILTAACLEGPFHCVDRMGSLILGGVSLAIVWGDSRAEPWGNWRHRFRS